jgi:hypothetical protein
VVVLPRTAPSMFLPMILTLETPPHVQLRAAFS